MWLGGEIHRFRAVVLSGVVQCLIICGLCVLALAALAAGVVIAALVMTH